MKRIKRIILSIISLVFTMSLIIQTSCLGFAFVSEFDKDEKERLSFFDISLLQNSQIKYLKKNDLLDDFLDYLYTEYNKQSENNIKEISKLLDFWNLSFDDNIETVKNIASTILTDRTKISIDSNDFFVYVKETLLDEKNGAFSNAEKDSEYGPLYLYMCLCYEIKTESDYAYKLLSKYNPEKITLNQLFDFDFDYNFSETQVPIILYNYIENNAKSASTAWPALNGNSIQQYAETWTNESYSTYHNPNYIYISDGGDCTNFASQCLFAGGLPMTSYVGEENNNGYTDTDTRWFYFNNNTSSGYSIATCWVRVSELYNYLSPHYACGERLANSGMTPYLNKGFLLQGRNLIGSYKHSVIVTKVNNSIRYCAHSSQRHDEPISTFYSGFYKCREVQVY